MQSGIQEAGCKTKKRRHTGCRDRRMNHNMANIERGGVPLEIERKYLIRYPDLDLLERICTGKAAISQTYLTAEKKTTRRIRKMVRDGQTIYLYTEKKKLSDMTRIEREREITEEEYLELMKEALPKAATIRKTRYFLPSGDRCFEIDIFPEWTDRAYAEVELENEEQTFVFPDCLEIIKEVTGDKRYTNKSLAKKGFIYEPI